jgi:hypothetical protein
MKVSARYKGRWSIPTMERMAALYILGYSNMIIREILLNEYGDYEIFPITTMLVHEFIKDNKEELIRMREELTIDCRREIAKQFDYFFKVTKNSETKMVDVYLSKMDNLLDELTDLDLQELDEMGNKKNTQRFMMILATIEKLHGMIAKITGTNALRDVEIHRLKKMAEKEIEESPMTPGGKMGAIEVESIPTTQFIE